MLDSTHILELPGNPGARAALFLSFFSNRQVFMQKRKCPKTRFDVCVKKCSPAPVARFGNFLESRCSVVTVKTFLGVIELQLLDFMFLLSRNAAVASPAVLRRSSEKRY